mmetsp:Transcript_3531/g.11593  ORF Transcript_3531/g.11593 Transcript_3531/m.11593 type:complete len:346 (-) Transcript_3531:168-1205(-)
MHAAPANAAANASFNAGQYPSFAASSASVNSDAGSFRTTRTACSDCDARWKSSSVGCCGLACASLSGLLVFSEAFTSGASFSCPPPPEEGEEDEGVASGCCCCCCRRRRSRRSARSRAFWSTARSSSRRSRRWSWRLTASPEGSFPSRAERRAAATTRDLRAVLSVSRRSEASASRHRPRTAALASSLVVRRASALFLTATKSSRVRNSLETTRAPLTHSKAAAARPAASVGLFPAAIKASAPAATAFTRTWRLASRWRSEKWPQQRSSDAKSKNGAPVLGRKDAKLAASKFGDLTTEASRSRPSSDFPTTSASRGVIARKFSPRRISAANESCRDSVFVRTDAA